MSETTPVPIVDDGKIPTALEVVRDYIISVSTGLTVPAQRNVNLFVGYNKDAPGIVRWLNLLPGGTLETMGTAMGMELPQIQLSVRGDKGQYTAPRDELIRLRYLLLAAREYTSSGLTLHAVTTKTGIRELGRDLADREGFAATLDLMVSPSYE